MPTTLSPDDLAALPISEGLRRRLSGQPEVDPNAAPAPVDTVDTVKGNWLGETYRSQAQHQLGNYDALLGAAQQATGFGDAAKSSYADYAGREGLARKLGPDVQSFADAKAAGGGLNYLGAAAYQAAGLAPDLALAAATGGVGEAAVAGATRVVARKIGVGLAKKAAIDDATLALGRTAAEKAVADGTMAAPASSAVADIQAREAAQKIVASRPVLDSTGKVIAANADDAYAKSTLNKAAQKVGHTLGVAGAFFPGTVAGSVDELQAHPGTDAARKVLGTDFLAATAGALPMERALGKLGLAGGAASKAKSEIAAEAQKWLPRVTQEALKQGTAGAAGAVAQTAVQLAGHKWIDDNVHLLGPDALDSYLAAAGTGFGFGALIGGGAEGVKGASFKGFAKREVTGDDGTTKTSLYARTKDRIAGLAAVMGKKAEDGRARPPVPGGLDASEAAAAHAEHLGVVQGDRDTSDAVNEVLRMAHGRLGEHVPGPVPQRPNPIELGPQDGPDWRLQTALLARVRPDNPMWQDRDATLATADTFAKVFKGAELDDTDAGRLRAFVNDPNSGITMRHLNYWRGFGPEYDVEQQRVQAGSKAPLANAQQSVADFRAHFGGDDAPDARSQDAQDSQYEGTGDGKPADEATAAYGAETPLPTLDTYISARNSLGDEHPDVQKLHQKLKDEVLSYNNTFTENTGAPHLIDAFNDRLNAPNHVQLAQDTQLPDHVETVAAGDGPYAGTDSAKRLTIAIRRAAISRDLTKADRLRAEYDAAKTKHEEGKSTVAGGKARQLLDLSNMTEQHINKMRAEAPGEGAVAEDADGNDISGRVGLLRAMETAQVAGTHVKPDTFTAGPVVLKANPKKGRLEDKHLTTLYDSANGQRPPGPNSVDIADLRKLSKPLTKKQQRAAGRTSLPRPSETDVAGRRAIIDKAIASRTASAFEERRPNERALGEGDFDTETPRDGLHESAPPQGSVPRGSDHAGYVSDMGGMRGATGSNPHEHLLRNTEARVAARRAAHAADKRTQRDAHDALLDTIGTALREHPGGRHEHALYALEEAVAKAHGGASLKRAHFALTRFREGKRGKQLREYQKLHAEYRAAVVAKAQEIAARTVKPSIGDHKIGKKIGEIELAKQHPVGGPEYDAARARLHDEKTGVSKDYLARAKADEFNGGSASFQKANDVGVRTIDKRLEAQLHDDIDKAMHGYKAPNEDVAKAIKAYEAAKKLKGEDRRTKVAEAIGDAVKASSKEDAASPLLHAARTLSDSLPKNDPIRRAVEAFDQKNAKVSPDYAGQTTLDRMGVLDRADIVKHGATVALRPLGRAKPETAAKSTLLSKRGEMPVSDHPMEAAALKQDLKAETQKADKATNAARAAIKALDAPDRLKDTSNLNKKQSDPADVKTTADAESIAKTQAEKAAVAKESEGRRAPTKEAPLPKSSAEEIAAIEARGKTRQATLDAAAQQRDARESLAVDLAREKTKAAWRAELLADRGRLEAYAKTRGVTTEALRARLSEEAAGVQGRVADLEKELASHDTAYAGMLHDREVDQKDEPPVPTGKVRLYRGDGAFQKDGTRNHGWFTTSREKAIAQGNLQFVDVKTEHMHRFAQDQSSPDEYQINTREPVLDNIQTVRKIGQDDEEAALKRLLSGKPEPKPKAAPPAPPIDAIGDSKPGEHDHNRETALANAVSRALGFNDAVVVVGHDGVMVDKLGGGYVNGARRILLGDELQGRERIQVLSHEIGHATIASYIAQKLGIAVEKLSHLRGDGWMNDPKYGLIKADPELHAALSKDFEKWKSGLDLKNMKGTEIRASRAPEARAEGILQRNHGVKFTDETPERQTELLSFNEWTADHIARALTGRHEGQSIIGKFFKGMAEKLKQAFDLLTGKGGSKYAPAKSVDAWVKQMFNREKTVAGEVIGRPVSVRQGEAGVRAGVGVGLGVTEPKALGSTVASISTFAKTLPAEAQQILNRVLNRASMTQLFRKAFAGDESSVTDAANGKPRLLTDMANDTVEGPYYRMAMAVILHARGDLKTEAGLSKLLNFNDNILKIANLAGDGHYAERIFQDLASGEIDKAIAAREADASSPAYSPRKLEEASRGFLQKALNEIRASGAAIKATSAYSRYIESNFTRLQKMGVAASRQVLAGLHKPVGATGDNRGMIVEAQLKSHLVHSDFVNAMKDVSKEDLHAAFDHLQQQKGNYNHAHLTDGARTAVGKFSKIAEDFYDYMDSKGMQNKRRADFWPVLLDVRGDEAHNAANQKTLYDMFSQPHFEEAIRTLPMMQVMDEHGVLSTRRTDANMDAMIKRLCSIREDQTPQEGERGELKKQNERVMQFVIDVNKYARKRSPEYIQRQRDLATFASVQTKEPASILARYFQPMIKTAEYTHQFGIPDPKTGVGSKLQVMLDTMKAQGASDADVEFAMNATKAALGTYGANGSPTLRALLPSLADKFNTKKTRDVLHAIQVYENSRLLSTPVLSSLTDPLGIAVRAGGDMGILWQGFKVGIKSLVSKQTRAELKEMSSRLGNMEEMLSMGQLQDVAGQEGSPKLRRLNDFLFKINGLTAFTRGVRYMAMQSAHGFLVKHAEGGSDTSQRYLDELNLKAGDIQTVSQVPPGGRRPRTMVRLLTEAERAANPSDVARDDRVRGAMMQFIDEAVLRPHSQQKPLWHSDPYMSLVSQYKSFAYAIFDQIGGRIAHELRNGNYHVLTTAMAYLPVTIAAEMMRGFVQYGPGGNPNRDKWGMGDYTGMGLDRTGLLGPRFQLKQDVFNDAQRGRLPGWSQAGPAANQVTHAIANPNFGTFETALPLSSAWQHWGDPNATDDRGLRRGVGS